MVASLRRSSLKRKARLHARAREFSEDEAALAALWHKAVLALAPRVQGLRVCPVCRRPVRLSAHHVVSREWLRRYIRTHALPPGEASAVLWDVRNGLPCCEKDHDLHTRAQQRFPAVLLTRANREFAREVGAEYLLDRYYERST